MDKARPFLHFEWAEKHDSEWDVMKAAWRADHENLARHLSSNQKSKFLSMASFERYRQVICISPQLCEALARTTLEGITFEDILWPYNGVYIAFLGGLDLPALSLEGPVLGSPLLGIYLARPFAPGNLFLSDETTERNGTLMSFFGVCQPSSQPQDYDCVAGLVPDWRQDNEIEGTLKEKKMSMLRVGLNALLYLSTTSAQKHKRTEVFEGSINARKKKRRRKRDLPTTTVTYIGESLPRESPSSSPSDGTPTREHWVRGHWHKYWIGKGRTKLRVNLIMPFRRGCGPGIEGRIYRDR